MIRVLRLLRASVGSDRDLLARYVRNRDEEAFEALVHRYGNGVWATCVRLAGRDAEDAFQAVFLTLSRKAGTVTGSLPAWLHAVTRRVASSLRRTSRRRAAVEEAAARPDLEPVADPSLRDGLVLLDEELSRLPERYRAVLIVCCLEGRSRDEAAVQLGWSEGQVKGRLERAREMLRTRLARRGVELGGILLAAAIGGPAPARITPSPAIVSLTNGVLRDMAIQKYKLVGVLLVAAVVSVGVLWAAGQDEKERPPAKADQPKVGQDEKEKPLGKAGEPPKLVGGGPAVKWEYTVLQAESSNREIAMDKMQAALNRLGEEGWECTGTVSEVTGLERQGTWTKAVLILKRPKR
jgi:RNA polymerase sigma factor (sigma-70 family)